ncbi:uncharacterized protein METZ01_LOCUS480627, partial [marine metagenome]
RRVVRRDAGSHHRAGGGTSSPPPGPDHRVCLARRPDQGRAGQRLGHPSGPISAHRGGARLGVDGAPYPRAPHGAHRQLDRPAEWPDLGV